MCTSATRAARRRWPSTSSGIAEGAIVRCESVGSVPQSSAVHGCRNVVGTHGPRAGWYRRNMSRKRRPSAAVAVLRASGVYGWTRTPSPGRSRGRQSPRVWLGKCTGSISCTPWSARRAACSSSSAVRTSRRLSLPRSCTEGRTARPTVCPARSRAIQSVHRPSCASWCQGIGSAYSDACDRDGAEPTDRVVLRRRASSPICARTRFRIASVAASSRSHSPAGVDIWCTFCIHSAAIEGCFCRSASSTNRRPSVMQLAGSKCRSSTTPLRESLRCRDAGSISFKLTSTTPYPVLHCSGCKIPKIASKTLPRLRASRSSTQGQRLVRRRRFVPCSDPFCRPWRGLCSTLM